MLAAVGFESLLRARWAIRALRDTQILGDTGRVTVVRFDPDAAETVIEPERTESTAALAAVAMAALATALLTTLAIHGFTLAGITAAVVLGVCWGVLYGGLAGALTGANAPSLLLAQMCSDGAAAVAIIECNSTESLERARRYLMACAGARASA